VQYQSLVEQTRQECAEKKKFCSTKDVKQASVLFNEAIEQN
jgi:hypothetical protein